MKTASVRQLRNEYSKLMKWIEAGQEISITRRGKPIARLVPEVPKQENTVDWSKSAAVTRDRSGEKKLTKAQTERLWKELRGPY
jgi:prevent-host-death family protein